MWKKFLVVVIFMFISPVIGSKRKKSDSAQCQRTNKEAFRYCTKSCKSDKDCKSSQKSGVKCLCDGDCGMSCVKNNLRCDEPPKTRNSRQTISNGRSFGSVVTYTCTSPYKMRGSAKRTCRAIGRWDGKKTRCKIMCKDPGEITFGNRQMDGLQAGKYIKYWCLNDDYNLVGAERIVCLNTGEWSAPKPKCELPQCDPPNIPDSAEIVWPRKIPKKYDYSDRVILKCKEGYFKSRGGWLSCNGGNWRGDIKCSPKSCGSPGDLANGKVIGYVYSFKEKVEYVCNVGFNLKGPAYRICQANEEWGGRQPVCEVVNCGPLDKPDHGDIIEQVALTYGKRIVFECTEKGYEMNGSKIRTCQSNGKWSGSPTSCEIVKCGDPGTPANGQQHVTKGFVYGGSVRFTCNKDYTLSSATTMYCQENKDWTASVPRCLAPCPDPGRPYQGNRIDDDFRHDKTVRFTCPDDYFMEGVRSIRCADGQWSNTKPSCKAPCKALASPNHGYIRGNYFRHGGSVTFSCSYGYTRAGSFRLTCNDGNWNHPTPICKGICSRPRLPNKGKMHGNKDRFIEGDEVTFSCFNGYDLFGDAKMRCVDRKWKLIGNLQKQPECKARCRYSGSPAHGFYVEGSWRRDEMIRHGVKISYKCLPTYTMVGANMQECDNGRWTKDVPQCKASCQSPDVIPDGRKIGDDYGHGKTVMYRCDAEYILEGNERLTCDDGKWSSSSPKCKAPCDKPRAPVNGKIQGGDFRHNMWVAFVCDQNYQLDGDVRIHCDDGTWSGSVPDCVAVCSDPGEPANGRRLHHNFQNGQAVTFRCNKNYGLVGNDTIRCNDGKWSGDTPECKGQCTYDSDPDNGFTTTGVFGKGDKRPHGSSVEYDCNPSYTLVGSNIRHCDDGKWSTSPPSCMAPCNDPGLLERGIRNGNDFSHGQTVTYECTIPGYSLVGNPQLTCNDGSWDMDPPQCKASCNPLPPFTNGKVQNDGITHGTLVSFKCKRGFLLKGSQQIICLDGNWNASSPTCKGTCTNPGPLQNGAIIGDDYSYNSSVKFHCNSGFELRGQASLTCLKGVWNGEIPECKKRCQDPGRPHNGWKLGMNHSHGGSVKFTCKDARFDIFGASQIMCNDGEWSDRTPSCEARCSDPGVPDNGMKEGDDYRSRANVTFKCNPPLELIGSRVISCYEGKWSDTKPTCSSCGKSLGLENTKNPDIRITSPESSINSNYEPSAARLNGNFAWCPSRPSYLQIDLGKNYKLTAITTQGGASENTWVRRYRISLMAGNTFVVYSESGKTKDIEANTDASSVLKYTLKEPFVTSTVRIEPMPAATESICLRTELYGCDPTPDCVLVGSMFWGMWAYNDGAHNYYRAYITKLTETHLDFALKINKAQTKSYLRTKPVLILDEVPSMEDITVNSRVIAQHRRDRSYWYRTGNVTSISDSNWVTVKFDDGKLEKFVVLENLRLVQRPRFC